MHVYVCIYIFFSAIEWEDKRLRNYNFEEIVNMVIFCLRKLFPEKNFPESLPFGMQNRYRLSTQLMEVVQVLFLFTKTFDFRIV